MQRCLLFATLMMLAALRPLAAEDLWINLAYIDHESKQEHYYLCRIAPEHYEQLWQPDGPAFVRVSHASWWKYDEDDEIAGLATYADEMDSGEILIPVRSIIRIAAMKQSPADLLAARKKQAADAIP